MKNSLYNHNRIYLIISLLPVLFSQAAPTSIYYNPNGYTLQLPIQNQVQASECRGDSVHLFALDTANNSYQLSGRTFISFDTNNHPAGLVKLKWNGTTWANDIKDSIESDAYGYTTFYRTMTGHGNSWLNEAQHFYTYDSKKNQTLYLSQIWKGMAWRNNEKLSSVYNANNNFIGETHQLWDTTAAIWMNDYMDTTIYNASNRKTCFVYMTWNRFTTTWQNAFQHVFSNDALGNEIGNLTLSWNPQHMDWDTTERIACTFDANHNTLTAIAQSYSNHSWHNRSKNIYNYNYFNDVTCETHQLWNGTAWVNSIRYTSPFDGDNNNMYGSIESWTGTTWRLETKYNNNFTGFNYLITNTQFSFGEQGQVLNSDSLFQYACHQGLISAINELGSGVQVSIFPNPTDNQLNLEVGGQQIERISIYDSNGSLVTQIQKPINNQIDVSALPNGVYIAQIMLSSDKGGPVENIVKKRFVKM